MSNLNIYEIAKEYEEVINNLYDDNGEINETAMAKLESNEIAFEKKAIALSSWIKNMEAEKEAIENAKKAMLDRERSLKNKMENWRDYLKSNMERRGISEIKCPYFILKLKKNPPSVDDFNPKMIPDEYKRIKVEIDRVKIKQAINDGIIVPGACLKQDMGLSIR